MLKEYFAGANTTHIKEAIALNTARLPLYAKLTQNKSVPFSKKLVFYEKLSIPFAMITDFRARPFQRKGVPVIAEDFVEMSLVGPFRESYPFPVHDRNLFKRIDGKAISKKLHDAYRSNSFEAVAHVAETELKAIEHIPAFQCMTRHLLESVLRAANNAPHHIKKCAEKKIKSCEYLSRYLIWAHIPLFKQAASFDEEVLPIQLMGVPFLYQDMPPIAPIADCYRSSEA